MVGDGNFDWHSIATYRSLGQTDMPGQVKQLSEGTASLQKRKVYSLRPKMQLVPLVPNGHHVIITNDFRYQFMTGLYLQQHPPTKIWMKDFHI